MALKRLSTPQMITISGPWVTQGTPQREVLNTLPDLAAVLGRVEAAHNGLLSVQPSPTSGALLALNDKESMLDQHHDQLVRAIDSILTGFAFATDNAEQARALHELHDLLLPSGLSVVQMSYREEAGFAKMLDERLTADYRVQLKALPIPGNRTVLDLVNQWLEAGRQLADLEETRVNLQQPRGVTPADSLRARNLWIRSVSALVSMAELCELEDDKMNLVFGALWAVEKVADRRSIRRGAGASIPPAAPPVADPAPPTKSS